MSRNQTRKLTLTAMFIAIGLVLPFITGQIPTLGQMFTPMHFPVILGALFLGPVFGFMIGAISPLLRTFLFSRPPFPLALTMTFELAVYGLIAGLIFYYLNKKKVNYILNIFVSMIISMILARFVYAAFAMIFLEATNYWDAFILTFTGSSIGIALQLVLVPILAVRLKKYVETTQ